MTSSHESRRVALESGATTTVECWGDAGPAVLCVHGIAASRRDFARLGDALAGTHRVFAYDQRGHGDAEPREPMTLDALAGDLRAVADSIGTVAAVVGHAWGGAVALTGGPKVARALVLIDPVIRAAPGTSQGGWDLRDRLASLKIPTTILLAGRESAVAADDLARVSPAVRVETFAGHGHALHRSAFKRFAELVRDAVPA
ncbi:MAG TPA: alpha/beta hydrolase [Candidatus Elarobacter sp.]|nr:alpha/beta hydrolase [Candidatus Elarobacter sp.]